MTLHIGVVAAVVVFLVLACVIGVRRPAAVLADDICVGLSGDNPPPAVCVPAVL